MTFRIDRYRWTGGSEAMLRFGPDDGPNDGPVVIAAPALFEEANRTRALLVDTLRRLAARGIAGALPDLPGQNESLVATCDARLADWRSAFASAAAVLPGPAHVVAIRGGALLDAEAEAAVAVASRWYLAPLSGATQARELRRLRAAGGGSDHAGNLIDDAMMAALDGAEPVTIGPIRVARLSADPRPADATFVAAPPWRASEPRGEPALAQAMADDIARWIATCAA